MSKSTDQFNFLSFLAGLETGGSAGWALGYSAGGREFDSGRTITKGLKIAEEKVLPL